MLQKENKALRFPPAVQVVFTADRSTVFMKQIFNLWPFCFYHLKLALYLGIFIYSLYHFDHTGVIQDFINSFDS